MRTILWRGVRCPAVDGLLVVKRRGEADAAGREAVASSDGSSLEAVGLAVVAVANRMTQEVASARRAGKRVSVLRADEWSEPVLLDRISRVPADALVGEQWGFDAVNADAIFDGNPDLSGVLLAVLDSGMPIEAGAPSHQELRGGRFSLARDVVNGDHDPADDHGHGTHVLGVAAANADNGAGIAGLWQGPVLVVKVFDSQGAGSSVTFADGLIAAVDFAVTRRLRLVVNYSGGGVDSDTKRTAVNHAQRHGALLVAAAGNNFGSPIEFPAAYSRTHDNVIAVGALDRARQLAAFCNVGPEMNVVAPGVDILSTLPNYFVTLNVQGKQTKFDRLDGTSQASPLVAALAAHVWARHPTLSAAAVRKRVLDAAGPPRGGVFGSGMIDVRRALS